MKRLLTLIAVILFLIGCTKESSLVGTKWIYQFDKSTYVLEFTSSTDVRTYQADANYNFQSALTEGKYTYSNNKVVFKDDFCIVKGMMLILYYRYNFRYANIEGDVMKIVSDEEQIIIPIVDGKVQEPEIEKLGEYDFTLMKL